MSVQFLSVLLTLILISLSKSIARNEFIELKSKMSFVDKTPLIKEILKHKILFLNSPSGFGKSTNLDMIRLFLSNLCNKNEIATYFEGTKIFQDAEFVKLHLGEYPVIWIDLSADDSKASNFDSILKTFKISLHHAFVDHKYLLQSENFDEERKETIKRYTNLLNVNHLDKIQSVEGLELLAELLYQHYSKPVVLLIDGFGLGVTEQIVQRNLDVSTVLGWYSTILKKTINSNSTICHAVFTGETWLYGLKGSSLTSLQGIGFLQRSEFNNYYGFTSDEAEALMVKFKVEESQREDIFKWFGGYTSLKGNVQFFNPSSFLQFLQSRSIKKYWSGSQLGTELIEFMFQEMNFKNNFTNLVKHINSTVRINLERDLRLVCLQNLKNKIGQIPEHCGNFFFRILLETGYLTFAGSQEDVKNVTLTIPNEEIRSCLKQYTSKFGVVDWLNNSTFSLGQILE